MNIKRQPDDLSLCLSSSDTSSLGLTSPMKRLICSQQGWWWWWCAPNEELRNEKRKTLGRVSFGAWVNTDQAATHFLATFGTFRCASGIFIRAAVRIRQMCCCVLCRKKCSGLVVQSPHKWPITVRLFSVVVFIFNYCRSLNRISLNRPECSAASREMTSQGTSGFLRVEIFLSLFIIH